MCRAESAGVQPTRKKQEAQPRATVTNRDERGTLATSTLRRRTSALVAHAPLPPPQTRQVAQGASVSPAQLQSTAVKVQEHPSPGKAAKLKVVRPLHAARIKSKQLQTSSLLRKNSGRKPVNTYSACLTLELTCMFMAVIVHSQIKAAELEGSLADQLSSLVTSISSNYIDQSLVLLTLVQFFFIVADRGAYLARSVAAKLLVTWMSMAVYMHLVFSVWTMNLSLQVFFFLKALYWILSAIQIRSGYHEISALKHGATSITEGDLSKYNQVMFTVVHAVPFVHEIRVRLHLPQARACVCPALPALSWRIAKQDAHLHGRRRSLGCLKRLRSRTTNA